MSVDPTEWPGTEALIDEIHLQVVNYSPIQIRWFRSDRMRICL